MLTAYEPVHRFIFSGWALLAVTKLKLNSKGGTFLKLDIYPTPYSVI